MGRRWWQKEARAKAEQERRDAKQAVVSSVEVVEVVSSEAPPTEENDQHDTHAVESVIAAAVEELTQAVEDSSSDVQEIVADDAADQQDEDVQVPGITIAQAVNPPFSSNKKKRRR